MAALALTSAFTILLDKFNLLYAIAADELISALTIVVTKSCNPSDKVDVTHQDTIVAELDTVYLPNPNPVKVIIHDTLYKTSSCTKKHCDNPKSTKDTSK